MEVEIDNFKQYLSRRYPDRSTTKHYMSDLAIFQNFVGDVPPQEITIKKVDQFVQSQSDQGLKSGHDQPAAFGAFQFFRVSDHRKREHPLAQPGSLAPTQRARWPAFAAGCQ